MTCPNCKGKGYIVPKPEKPPVLGLKEGEEPPRIKKPLDLQWEKEFETDIEGFYKHWIEKSLNRYLGYGKVKIKCKKDCIQIERVR